MKRCLKEDVKFITSYNTKKMAMFCLAKDKIKITQKANIIYDIQCPACKEHDIGVLLPAFMNMEADMINQCSNT